MLALCAGTTSAMADDCNRHGDAGGTVLGAIAGGLIGGAVSHGNGGAVVGGAILGGLAGNAISRDIDCDDRDAAARAYHDSFYGDVGERYEWHGHDRGYVVTTPRVSHARTYLPRLHAGRVASWRGILPRRHRLLSRRRMGIRILRPHVNEKSPAPCNGAGLFAIGYLPFHCGARFSAKAFGPSRRSSLLNIAATAG